MQKVANDHQLCIVCQRIAQLYFIAPCTHQFCQQCCINYIKSQADNFSQAKCLQQGCDIGLAQSGPIYSLLDEKTKLKLAKFQNFQYLRKNTNAKACKATNCDGFFMINDHNCECKICHLPHCPTCLERIHLGKCPIKAEQQFKKFKYQKCPNCTIWVEKVEGCRYIKCKCGTHFCYNCGSNINNDLCSKKQLWQSELEVRQQLKKLQFKFPNTVMNWILLMPQILVCLLIIIPFTIVMSLAIICFIVLVAILLLVIGPLGLFCENFQDIKGVPLQCFSLMLLLLFYPICGAILSATFLVCVLTYPICRFCCSNGGMYLQFDKTVSDLAAFYLQFLRRLLQCCLNTY